MVDQDHAVGHGVGLLEVLSGEQAADLARVADVLQDSGISVDEIALRRPTLDDAFLALTGHAPRTDEPRYEEAAV